MMGLSITGIVGILITVLTPNIIFFACGGSVSYEVSAHGSIESSTGLLRRELEGRTAQADHEGKASASNISALAPLADNAMALRPNLMTGTATEEDGTLKSTAAGAILTFKLYCLAATQVSVKIEVYFPNDIEKSLILEHDGGVWHDFAGDEMFAVVSKTNWTKESDPRPAQRGVSAIHVKFRQAGVTFKHIGIVKGHPTCSLRKSPYSWKLLLHQPLPVGVTKELASSIRQSFKNNENFSDASSLYVSIGSFKIGGYKAVYEEIAAGAPQATTSIDTIFGGGWTLLRSIPASSTWYTASDALKGSASPYGDSSDLSQQYNTQHTMTDSDIVMFASGDLSHYVIVPFSVFNVDFTDGEVDFTSAVLASSGFSPSLTNYYFYHRSGYATKQDPSICAKDSAEKVYVLYAEDANAGDEKLRYYDIYGGMRVYYKTTIPTPQDDLAPNFQGKYHFRAKYGEDTIEWKQSNWLSESKVTGFECVQPTDCDKSELSFSGLARSSDEERLLDGDGSGDGTDWTAGLLTGTGKSLASDLPECNGDDSGGASVVTASCNSICAKTVNELAYSKPWCFTTDDRSLGTDEWCWCDPILADPGERRIESLWVAYSVTSIQGPEGQTGIAGVVGPEGPQGPVGDTGNPGEDGNNGSKGKQGPPGLIGHIGEVGLSKSSKTAPDLPSASMVYGIALFNLVCMFFIRFSAAGVTKSKAQKESQGELEEEEGEEGEEEADEWWQEEEEEGEEQQ